MLETEQIHFQQAYLDKSLFHNFRNLPHTPFQFTSGINCLYGPNGSGKTSVIEAVYYFLHKKSFRKNARFPQILSVNCGKPEILFQLSLSDQDGHLEGYSRKFTDLGMGRLNQPLKWKISCMVISPLDSLLFNLKAESRRDFFDQNLVLLSSEYKNLLKTYQKLVKQKNKLLQDYNLNHQSIIFILNKEIAQISVKIIDERLKFIEQLNHHLTQNYFELFSLNHSLYLRLESKFQDFSVADFERYYQEYHQREIMLKRQFSGVHLDDYYLYFDDMLSYEFCSLGQQKMSYLALYFSFISLYKQIKSSFPIVMIDDISSELDSERWLNLIQFLKQKSFQVILTTANENFFKILKTSSEINEIYLSPDLNEEKIFH